jgi:hypothetical protein
MVSLGDRQEGWNCGQWLFGLVCIVAEITWLNLFIPWLLAAAMSDITKC